MTQFPQLRLDTKLDELRTEALDFQMASSASLPADNDVDEFWCSVHNIKSMKSSLPAYSNLLVLVRALLSLPASNADSEQCFSMVRKIDSEERSHLERTTVASLLALKLNVDSMCYNFKPPSDLLKMNKSAVRMYNEEHGSYDKDIAE